MSTTTQNDLIPMAAVIVSDLITADNLPPVGDKRALAWLESIGLDPYNIPADGIVIDPFTLTLYWREFALSESGERTVVDSFHGRYQRTRTRTLQLDTLPDFLQEF